MKQLSKDLRDWSIRNREMRRVSPTLLLMLMMTNSPPGPQFGNHKVNNNIK